jgi:outer membrane murein-binding lipoprotein Lpp
MAPLPDFQWVANPDIITSAIKLLAGAVITLGGMLVAGGRWVAAYMMKQMNTRMDGMETKLERVAQGMEQLALTTTNQITKIEVRCEERHSNHHRSGDRP